MGGYRQTSHGMRFFAMLLFCYMWPCFFSLFNFFIFLTFLIFQHFSRTHKNHDPAINIAKNCNMGLYKGSRAIRSGSGESAEASAQKFDAIRADRQSIKARRLSCNQSAKWEAQALWCAVNVQTIRQWSASGQAIYGNAGNGWSCWFFPCFFWSC